ncbi:MAG: tRNA (guanine(10)-N(2))-dimethyltransferase [Candidatus Micrarchaeota archaeon]
MPKLRKIKEGKAVLLVPERSARDPFHSDVFYNPAMEFNRSVSSLALQASLELLESKQAQIVDGLSATGARGVRYALENKGVGRVWCVEANPSAVRLLKKNIAANKMGGKVVSVEGDLNRWLLNSDEFYDFIEVDPFGSPVYYLENAVKRLKKKAVLSVTATDLANLCGARATPCVKHYQARPLNNEFCHESALRILVGKIARVAMEYDFGVTPLLCFYRRHYAKAFILCEKGAVKADANINGSGFVLYCPKCLWRSQSKRLPGECPECSSRLEYAGPLWTEGLQSKDFLHRVAKLTASRNYTDGAEISKLLGLLGGEDGFPPFFYDLHFISGRLGVQSPSSDKVLTALRKSGFKAERTHYSPTGIKTDAGISAVKKSVA